MENLSPISEVLTSKGYRKNGMTFENPSKFLAPVLEIFENSNYSGFGSHEVEMEEDGEILKAFGRAGVIKTFEIDENLNYQVGFLYSFEVGKPFIKVFSGVNVKICSNMAVFNPSDIRTFVIATSGLNATYEAVAEFIKNVYQKIEEAKKVISFLKGHSINTDQLNRFIGQICRNFSAVKNVAGTNCIMNACRLFEDNTSMYYAPKNKNISLWLVYNALTEYFGEKVHIMDHPEKVLSLFEELKNFSEKEFLSIEDQVLEISE